MFNQDRKLHLLAHGCFSVSLSSISKYPNCFSVSLSSISKFLIVSQISISNFPKLLFLYFIEFYGSTIIVLWGECSWLSWVLVFLAHEFTSP